MEISVLTSTFTIDFYFSSISIGIVCMEKGPKSIEEGPQITNFNTLGTQTRIKKGDHVWNVCTISLYPNDSHVIIFITSLSVKDTINDFLHNSKMNWAILPCIFNWATIISQE